MRPGDKTALRLGVAADAVALAALDKLVNPGPWNENQFSQACAAGQGLETVLVLERHCDLQGFIVYSQLLDEVAIHNIAVHPALQGEGLGELLLTEVLSRSREAGARRCVLELRTSNRAARGLYVKLGFRVDGLRKDYYRSPEGLEDAILMSREMREQE